MATNSLIVHIIRGLEVRDRSVKEPSTVGKAWVLIPITEVDSVVVDAVDAEDPCPLVEVVPRHLVEGDLLLPDVVVEVVAVFRLPQGILSLTLMRTIVNLPSLPRTQVERPRFLRQHLPRPQVDNLLLRQEVRLPPLGLLLPAPLLHNRLLRLASLNLHEIIEGSKTGKFLLPFFSPHILFAVLLLFCVVVSLGLYGHSAFFFIIIFLPLPRILFSFPLYSS